MAGRDAGTLDTSRHGPPAAEPDGLDAIRRRPWSAAERRRGAVARLRDTTATSAGGIVVGYEGQRARLVVGMRRRERNSVRWTLPKGTPNPGESLEETALREVGEETGLRVRIVEPLPSIEYRFVLDGARIHKTVHYWLMEPTGGDLADHDHEFEQVRWVAFDEAPALLTFETERELVAAAAERLGGGAATALGQEPAT
jgi:8-oxo-dGTP pyrophosphatase MutT (NUDIX family)